MDYGMGASALEQIAAAASGAANVALSQVERVEIASQLSPTFTYNPNSPPVPGGGVPGRSGGAGGGPAWYEKATKPSVTVYGHGGIVLYHYAPYGEPTPGLYFWPAIGLVAAAGAATAYFAVRGLTRPKRLQNPRRRTRTFVALRSPLGKKGLRSPFKVSRV